MIKYQIQGTHSSRGKTRQFQVEPYSPLKKLATANLLRLCLPYCICICFEMNQTFVLRYEVWRVLSSIILIGTEFSSFTAKSIAHLRRA